MADLVTSPTNLAKYNACFAWGDFNQSSYVGHLESPSGILSPKASQMDWSISAQDTTILS